MFVGRTGSRNADRRLSEPGADELQSPRRSRQRRPSHEQISAIRHDIVSLVRRSTEVAQLDLTAVLKIESDSDFLHLALPYLENNGGTGLARSEAGKVSRSGGKSLRNVSVYLSPAHDWLCWVPSSSLSNAFTLLFRGEHRLEIAHIVRVWEGQNTTNFTRRKSRIKLKQIENESSRSFSAVTHDRSLDLIMRHKEMRDIWVRALTLLIVRKNAERTEDYKENSFLKYLKMQWNRADTDRSGELSLSEVRNLLKKMNIMVAKKWVLSKINEFDENFDGVLNFEEFYKFMVQLAQQRAEVTRIIKWIQRDSAPRRSRGLRGIGRDEVLHTPAHEEHRKKGGSDLDLSVGQLLHFLNKVQKGRHDPAWTEESVKQRMRTVPNNTSMHWLSPMHFAQFIDAPTNSVFDPVSHQLGCGEDPSVYMSQPLSHYWINSSHNTYLTGDQLQGHSTSDQYAYVLEQGVRCIELDCWDGGVGVPEGNKGDEPIITHGHTLCTKIFFRDAIQAIKTSAFSKSPYPVILSIEMHCSPKFQDKMAEICKEILGEHLVMLPPFFNMDRLPSPEELKYKILIKGKQASAAAGTQLNPRMHCNDDEHDEEEEVAAAAAGENESDGEDFEYAPSGAFRLRAAFSRARSLRPGSPDGRYLGAHSPLQALARGFQSPLGLVGRGGEKKSLHMPHLHLGESFSHLHLGESFSQKVKGLAVGKDEKARLKILQRIQKKEGKEGSSARGGSSRGSRGSRGSENISYASSEEEDLEDEDAAGAIRRMPSLAKPPGVEKLSAAWSSLVYLAAVHFKSFSQPGQAHEMSSFSENKARKFAETHREEYIEYNERQISRIYPHGKRVDSSNLDPVPAWAAGCQMVALNCQTGDVPIWLNFGKFRENGGTGYVLKPPYMRGAGPKMLPCQLIVNVLSCQRLPNNDASSDIVDVYVSLELHGVSGDAQVTKTETIMDNGFNPSWAGKEGDEDEGLADIGEEFVFEVHDREVAFLKLMVMDANVRNDDMIGQCCIPVTAIRPGIRHVPIYDSYNGQLPYAGILCRFAVSYIP